MLGRPCKASPHGETVSYREIAKRVDNPKGPGAVGLANNRNPLPIIIPCRRVAGKNGKMVGHDGGLPIKEWLLKPEQES